MSAQDVIALMALAATLFCIFRYTIKSLKDELTDLITHLRHKIATLSDALDVIRGNFNMHATKDDTQQEYINRELKSNTIKIDKILETQSEANKNIALIAQSVSINIKKNSD